MRNTEIDVICTGLSDIWKKVPFLRLGQLLHNTAAVTGKDLFYISDDDMLKYIRTMVENCEVSDGSRNKGTK